MRYLALAVCEVALAGWVLFHIIGLTLYGKVTIYEEVSAWLIGDWVVTLGMLLFGLYMVGEILHHRNQLKKWRIG